MSISVNSNRHRMDSIVFRHETSLWYVPYSLTKCILIVFLQLHSLKDPRKSLRISSHKNQVIARLIFHCVDMLNEVSNFRDYSLTCPKYSPLRIHFHCVVLICTWLKPMKSIFLRAIKYTVNGSKYVNSIRAQVCITLSFWMSPILIIG